MTSSASQQVVVPADHPSLAGHFPGKPIVPGVLILELVADAARSAIGPLQVRCVRAVKFTAPLLPGQTLDIRLDWDAALIRFRCESSGRALAQGTLEYMRTPA